MYHTIEFVRDFWINVEISPKHRLERVRVRRATRVDALVKPYVVESADGPVEVADLVFADGSVTREVRCGCFWFVDSPSGGDAS
jgi:hypothetical protein